MTPGRFYTNCFTVRIKLFCVCSLVVTSSPPQYCSGQATSGFEKILELPHQDNLTIDPNKVIAECSDIIENRKKHSVKMAGKALLARGNTYGVLGKLNEAVRDFDEYCNIQPETVEILYLRATALWALGQFERAGKDIEKALQLNPKSAEAHVGLAGVLLRQGKEKEGLEALEKAITLNPKCAQAYFLKGLTHELSDPLESLRSMNKYLELLPYNTMGNLPYYYRGVALRHLNRTEEALASYLMARKMSPSSYNVAKELGLTYGGLGKYNVASHYGEECVKLDPKAPAGYFLCSVYYDKIGKTIESRQAAEKFFSLTKDVPGS